MQSSVSDDLRDAFQSLAEALAPVAQQLLTNNSSDYAQLEHARIALVSAARDLNADELAALFAGNDEFTKLKLLADEIDAKADNIANQERNVARIAGIGAGALSLVSAVGKGDVAGVLSAAKSVTAILD